MTKREEATLNNPKPKSRRALLAGAVGGLGAWAASVVGRAAPVEAAAGDPIRMGRINRAGGSRTILETSSEGAAFTVRQQSGAGAVRAEATSGRAVQAIAGHDGTGLWAYSPDHNAIFARTEDGIGVHAQALGSFSWALYALGRSSLNGDLVVDGTTAVHGQLFVNESITVDGTASFNNYLVAARPIFMQASGELPGPPGSSELSLFPRMAGGKMQLCVQFPSGEVKIIATES